MLRKSIAGLATAAALAAPHVALAKVDPGGSGPTHDGKRSALVHDNPLRDGKFLPQPSGAYASTPEVAGSPAASGAPFSWIDAGIGAATALGGVLAFTTARILTTRHREGLAA